MSEEEIKELETLAAMVLAGFAAANFWDTAEEAVSEAWDWAEAFIYERNKRVGSGSN